MMLWNRLLLLALPLLQVVLAQDDIVRFNFRFGFFDDNQTPLTEVIKEDVEGVLCQTQYFLSHLVQNATDSKSVHAKATQIDWGYYEGDELPAHINFTVEFTDAAIQDADVNWIDDRILITEMEALGQPGLQKFITEWVWKSEPEGLNFFLNANKMAFDGLKQEPVQGQLSEAACPETVAPTAAPTISPSPTLAPTVTPPNTISNANGTSVPPEGEGGPVVPPGTNGLGPNATGVPPPGAGNPNGAALPGGGNPSGAIPPPVAGTGVAPNNARKDWPFGPNYNTVNDLDTMADFSLQFAMFEEHETPPTLAHVNALMCEINAYFTEALRRKLLDGTIHSKGVYIDYYFDEGGVGNKEKEDIVVNFTAFVYYGDDEHNQVPVNDVFEAMKLTPVELKDMVEHYVWLSEPYQFNTFFHTERVGMNAAVRTTQLGDPKDVMLLEADGCILPPNPDGTPSSAIPSNPSNGIPAGGPATAETPPSSNIADYDFPDVGGNAKQTEIVTNFRVSNLENIQDPVALKAFGLDASFPVFTYEMVRELGNTNEAVRRLLRKAEQERRQLNVVPKSGSPQVDSIQQIDCPPRALPGLTCHDAVGRYEVLMSSDENVGDVQTRYTAASERAVNDGTYNNVLQRVDPDTPLFIGIMSDTSEIPPGSLKRGYTGEDPDEDDDGWFKWWYLLLLLLLLLCCCLICLYCWMLGRREEPTTTTKEVTVEERDLLVEEVEEFDDEDQPSAKDRGLAGPGDEEFVDDPDAGVMVPYANDDPNESAMPPPIAPPVVETGVLVPYDPDSQKAHDDQLERDRILNNTSQRGGDEGEYLNEASQRDNSTRDISQRDYGEEEQEDHGDETVPLTKVESDEQGVEVDDVDVDELQESRRSKKDDQEWEEDDR